MRKRLVRKTFDMIQEIAEGENKEVGGNDSDVGPPVPVDRLKYFQTFSICCRTTRSSGRTLESF